MVPPSSPVSSARVRVTLGTPSRVARQMPKGMTLYSAGLACPSEGLCLVWAASGPARMRKQVRTAAIRRIGSLLRDGATPRIEGGGGGFYGAIVGRGPERG